MQISSSSHSVIGVSHTPRTTEGHDQPPKKAGEQDNARIAGKGSNEELAADEKRELAKLQQRDRQVRAHETAHKAAGGNLTGAIQYEYKVGADGKRYAVGGEVSIDTSEERTPEATLQKAERIRAAALAPADPSSQDRAVADKAAQMAAEARTELLKQQRQQRAQLQPNETPEQTPAFSRGETTINPDAAIKTYSSLASEPSSGDAIDIIA